MSDQGSIDSIVDFEPIPAVPARIRRGLHIRHAGTNEERLFPYGVFPETWAELLLMPEWVVIDGGVVE